MALTVAGAGSARGALAPRTPLQRLLYAVVQLRHIEGAHEALGTGFFFRVSLPGGETSIALVTNQHVVAAMDGLTELTAHTRAPQGSVPSGLGTLRLPGTLGDGWVPHPSGLDLCAFPFEARLGPTMHSLFLEAVDPAMLVTDAEAQLLDVMEPVVLVGCPSGEEDHANAYPLFIQGATASDPAVDYNGHDEIALGLFANPGASGSPVFLAGTVRGVAPRLLGVMRATFAPRVGGSGVVEGSGARVDVSLPSGIGYAIKARALLPLADRIALVIASRGP